MFFQRMKSLLGKKLTNIAPKQMLKLRIKLKKQFEPEMDLIPFILTGKDSAVDVGANKGVFTYVISQYAGKCYSFEPVPYLARNIRKAFSSNKKVIFEQTALSNTTGEAEFLIPQEEAGWSTLEKDSLSLKSQIENNKVQRVTVKLNKLDNYNFDNLELIKIDVEGHEKSVLEGAADTLIKHKPFLIIEIEERHKKGAVENVKNYLGGLGYQCYIYTEGILKEYYTQSHDSGYIYNYVFIHSGKKEKLSKFLSNRD